MQSVTVRGSVELSFERFGAERDPLVLLISGAGAPAQFWPRACCAALAARALAVVRYSHRDTGLSTHFDRPYRIDELLLDMAALLSVLDQPRVHLVGHSMGGYLAQLAMCRFPGRFASVTSISSGPTVSAEAAAELGMTTASAETWAALSENRPSGDFERDWPGWLESWRLLNGPRPVEEDLAKDYTRALYAGDPRNAQVAANHIFAVATLPATLVRDLRRARCPFLVVHGSDDPLVPFDNGEASARLVPSSRLHRLDRAGHMFFNADTWRGIAEVLGGHIHAAG